MIIKSLSQNDFAEIVELQKTTFPDGWNEQMLESGLRLGNMKGLTATENGKLLGFITYSVNSDFAEIMDVLVCPSARRKGIATLLMTDFLSLIKDETKKVSLEVRESNEHAINLYKKFGFTQVYIRKKYYQDGENALVMEKEI